MERRRGDFESEAHQRHDDPGEKQRLDRYGHQFLSDGGQPGGAGGAVDETQPEEGERTRRAAEQEIFQACFGGANICFVERGHEIKRQAGQLEPDENHEQLFAADEQHQSDGRQQDEREIFSAIA
jgi:hypothetical protein